MTFDHTTWRLRESRKRILHFVPLVVIFLTSSAYAASVAVTNSTNESFAGAYYNVNHDFNIVSNGFSVAPSNSSASAQPCSWVNDGICKTALSAGEWFYSVTLTINSGAATSHTYTLTVTWSTGDGDSILGSVAFATPAAITAGQTMNFDIATASQSFSAPVGIMVIVT
jgi:hypothetical protein